MLKRRKISFKVSFELPDKATVQEAKLFVTQAIIRNRNTENVYTPMGNLNLHSFEVTRLRPEARKQ